MWLLFRTAFKNILGAGIRTWLNVVILSIVIVIMIGMNGIMDGWFGKARMDSIEWEFGEGQIWASSYDPYDLLKLSDAHQPIPPKLFELSNHGVIAPVLSVPASLFPDGRMVNVVVRGLEADQNIIKIPVSVEDEDYMLENEDIPVTMGRNMAKSLSMEIGDKILARWRDKDGTYDARTMVLTAIFETDNFNVDDGFVWMRLDNLQDLTKLKNEASYFICGGDYDKFAGDIVSDKEYEQWVFKDHDFLLKDIMMFEDSSRMESNIMFFILLSLALLTVFDTQALSIFQRKKEIGTYVALGMTPRRVTALFTIEGSLFSCIAIILSAIWGTPVLWLFKIHGWDIPADSMSGVLISDVMYPIYNFSTIVLTILIVVAASALISYFPARRIARMNMVMALKGKVD